MGRKLALTQPEPAGFPHMGCSRTAWCRCYDPLISDVSRSSRRTPWPEGVGSLTVTVLVGVTVPAARSECHRSWTLCAL